MNKHPEDGKDYTGGTWTNLESETQCLLL